jgi:hypothetical protein
MDNTRGQFEPISIEKFEEQMKEPEPLVFKVGEILIIRGSRLRVLKISRNKIILKLLPKI